MTEDNKKDDNLSNDESLIDDLQEQFAWINIILLL